MSPVVNALVNVSSYIREQQSHLPGHYRAFLQVLGTASQSVPFSILQMFAPHLCGQRACLAIYPALDSPGQSSRCVQGCDPTLDNEETGLAAWEVQEELLAFTAALHSPQWAGPGSWAQAEP